jgi:hypothetical protein
MSDTEMSNLGKILEHRIKPMRMIKDQFLIKGVPWVQWQETICIFKSKSNRNLNRKVLFILKFEISLKLDDVSSCWSLFFTETGKHLLVSMLSSCGILSISPSNIYTHYCKLHSTMLPLCKERGNACYLNPCCCQPNITKNVYWNSLPFTNSDLIFFWWIIKLK